MRWLTAWTGRWAQALVCCCVLASGLLVCPDGGVCQEGSACCEDVAGRYGCCPSPLSVRASAVLCPDQHSECPDATTCCQLPDGSWGCCPMAKAVCCDDKRHCCPEGSACDLSRSRCVSAGRDWRGWRPLMDKLPARPRVSAPAGAKMAEVASVTCPGGASSCPDSFTCCPQAGGDYGCCPYQDAACCDDGAHCCPSRTVCDLQRGVCRPAHWRRHSLQTLPADVECKTGTCPDETTCCQTSTGEYGCCPMPDATCCSDGLHCCPRGTACNLAAGMCDDPANGVRAASVRAASPPNTKCDESTACPGMSTCCRNVAGDWACCPLKQAVCCDDGAHCCPHGKRCNLEAETCDDASGATTPLPWLAKTAALATGVGATGLNACDEHTSCPKGASCCFMKSAGKWGCCPLPQAVCCQDGSHCCPAGHTCQPHRSSCSRGRRPVPWLAKTPAVAVADVKCDDKSSCAAGTTCCKLPTGEWGCCPLVKAVCCADREHCCPQGYSCNMETGTCEKPALAETTVPCDAAFACDERETCCRSSASQWACCPSPQAVCCADMKHCCPAHYSCHPSGGCVRTPPAWDV